MQFILKNRVIVKMKGHSNGALFLLKNCMWVKLSVPKQTLNNFNIVRGDEKKKEVK